MVDNDLGTSTEPARTSETICEGANEHVHLRGRDVIEFCETATCTTYRAEGKGFVEDKTVFVFELELDLLQSISIEDGL